MWEVLLWLMVGHAVGDFALQSDWMARHKTRHAKFPPEASKKPQWVWLHVLSSHCLIHAGAVYLATGYLWMGIGEFILHWLIDYYKGERKFGFHTDQILHLSCKILWWVLWIIVGPNI